MKLHITELPGNVKHFIFEDAKIIWRNFRGVAGTYNREGDRNFSLRFDEEDREIVEVLREAGWNIKHRVPKEGSMGDEFDYVNVKIRYNDDPKLAYRNPKVILVTDKGQVNMDEECIGELDMMEILNADIEIHPNPWGDDIRGGISLFARTIYVTPRENFFQNKYN